MRFSLNIGYVYKTVKFDMHLYNISGLYQPLGRPVLCPTSQTLWSQPSLVHILEVCLFLLTSVSAHWQWLLLLPFLIFHGWMAL